MNSKDLIKTDKSGFWARVLNKKHPKSWDLVVEDIKERDKFGTEKYGEPLKPFMNRGKKNLRDVYEEALDMVVYFRTLLYEQEGR